MGKIATINYIYELTGTYISQYSGLYCPPKRIIQSLDIDNGILEIPSSYKDDQLVQESDLSYTEYTYIFKIHNTVEYTIEWYVDPSHSSNTIYGGETSYIYSMNNGRLYMGSVTDYTGKSYVLRGKGSLTNYQWIPSNTGQNATKWSLTWDTKYQLIDNIIKNEAIYSSNEFEIVEYNGEPPTIDTGGGTGTN